MTKRRVQEAERLMYPLKAYVTKSERELTDQLAEFYGGVSNVLRRGLASLVQLHHAELTNKLRSDLVLPLTKD